MSSIERADGSRRQAWVLLAVVGVLTAVGTAGHIATASLIGHHPLVLMGLSPRVDILLLVAPRVAATGFFGVGLARKLAIDVPLFLLGSRHGERALGWIERHAGGSRRLLDRVARICERAAPAALLVWPGGVVCFFAGAGGLAWPAFVALDLAGSIIRLVVLRAAALALAGPLDHVVRFVTSHSLLVTGVVVLLVVVQALRGRRSQPEPTAEASEHEG